MLPHPEFAIAACSLAFISAMAGGFQRKACALCKIWAFLYGQGTDPDMRRSCTEAAALRFLLGPRRPRKAFLTDAAFRVRDRAREIMIMKVMMMITTTMLIRMTTGGVLVRYARFSWLCSAKS